MQLAAVLLSVFAAAQAIVVPQVGSSGHFHSAVPAAGVPQGKNITINGVLTYVLLAKGKIRPEHCRVAAYRLSDAFFNSFNFKLLAGPVGLRQELRQTYAPDYLNGDALPTGGDVTTWEVNHGEAQTTPPLLAVISALKSRGVKQIAATGYCFGVSCLYTTRLVNNTITVGTTAHPSSLNVPTDFDVVKAQSHIPIEINNAELDTGFTPALALETDAVLGDGQYRAGYSGASSTAWRMDLRSVV
ncbi:hypothetical protein DFH09DRAFT_1308869 [Mycena vulgaris]|nr:hypothetical protein DFH09DRAFT_1308869 [Mycena vulgaris]